MSTLDLPSRKLFIKDIGVYYMTSKCSLSPVSVWIQGIVIENNASSTELFIDDGTGVMLVIGYDKIPKCPVVKKGQYVMVSGIVVDLKTIPILRAIKVQDLSACVNTETMWMLEVIHQTLMCYS